MFQMRGAGCLLDIFACAGAWINQLFLFEFIQSLLILRKPGSLNDRANIPIETKPFQFFFNLLCSAGLHSWRIDVFDPENNLATLLAGGEPGYQIRPGVADVLGAGRRRGQSTDNLAHGFLVRMKASLAWCPGWFGSMILAIIDR